MVDCRYLFFLSFIFSLHAGICEGQSGGRQAVSPPRGWNSYDSFIWNINETEFLQNAEIISSRLKPFGYEYAVVDYLWYRRKDDPKASTRSSGTDVIDEWGRPVPDPYRWPSSVPAGGSNSNKGFIEVANKVHGMGLKFGIHIMRGLSFQAYNAATQILDTTTGSAYEEGGRVWTTKDIGIPDRACPWMDQGFMAINVSLGAGKAFMRSLYQQYADWGIDFVKHDCVFGEDLELEEITYFSQLLGESQKPIVYSLSPGVQATADLAKQVNGLANMYRITADDWDRWEHVKSHFNASRDFALANLIGAGGLQGNSWPDLDMLPLGWLSEPDSNEGPHRKCDLTLDEQRTQVTLWSIAKSPLMFGGDMRNLDDTTYGLITQPTLLEINSFSQNNTEFFRVWGSPKDSSSAQDQSVNRHVSGFFLLNYAAPDDEIRSWIAMGRNGEVYLAFFNLKSDTMIISAKPSDLVGALSPDYYLKRANEVLIDAKEIWSGESFSVTNDQISREVAPHGTALFVLNFK